MNGTPGTELRSGREHLAAELAWLDDALLALLDTGGGDPFADPLLLRRGLVVTERELRSPDGAGAATASQRWQSHLQRRAETEERLAAAADAALRAGVFLPLASLVRRLRLTPFERRCLVMGLAAEWDRKYEKWFGYLNDDVTCRFPTAELALRLLCADEAERRDAMVRLGGRYALRRLLLEPPDPYGEPQQAGPRAKLRAPLRLDERTVSYLLQTERLDARLGPAVQAFDPTADPPFVDPGDRALGRLRAFAGEGRALPGVGARLPVIDLWGPRGGGKKLRLRHLAAARRQRLLVVRMDLLPEERERLAVALGRIVREAVLTDAALAFSGGEESAAPRHREAWLTALDDYVRWSRRPLLGWTALAKRHPSELPMPAGSVYLAEEVGVPAASLRAAFWAAEASELEAEEETAGGGSRSGGDGEGRLAAWQELADKYRFTPGQIEQAWRAARTLALARGGRMPTPEELDAASRTQFRHRLAQLADPIEPARTWDDLVLPPEPLSLLKEACSRFKLRETVLSRWGFGRKLPYGTGLSLLLSGPPGTGKTMAAEVVARELGLELYRIDLSRIVSKYIGETEQRLSELFAEAEHSGAILFFDEGDALFGKRTEVKDAHDRYANLEAAYLLQRIEAYDGVTILATNLLQNMDEALQRRMSFIVKFPFPDAADRERIFRAHLPPDAPLSDDLDLAFLAARLDLSGGYIKNIVLAAAFLAAAERKPIGMRHFARAARQELVKMGKILVKDALAPYDDEVSETNG